MPYNPNDPNSDPNNPEGQHETLFPPSEVPDQFIPEERIRRAFALAANKKLGDNVHTVIEEMQNTLWNQRRGEITQEQADAIADKILVTDIPSLGLASDVLEYFVAAANGIKLRVGE